MNGGRAKWLSESDRPLVTGVPFFEPVSYNASEPDTALRAKLSLVLEASKNCHWNLVDVRGPDEFRGKVVAPAGLPETAQRAGHIPGAKSIPWGTAVQIARSGRFHVAGRLSFCSGRHLHH